MNSNYKKKQIISVPRVYDWVHSTSTINIRTQFRCNNPCTAMGIAKADTYQYNAVSDGIKTVYNDADELIEYGNQGILNPATVSYINLFINGMLQPKNQFQVETGKLTFIDDVPTAGSPITLQFVSIYV